MLRGYQLEERLTFNDRLFFLSMNSCVARGPSIFYLFFAHVGSVRNPNTEERSEERGRLSSLRSNLVTFLTQYFSIVLSDGLLVTP